MAARFLRAKGYQGDELNLPVADVEAAIPFYQRTFGLRVVSRQDQPHRSAILARDDVRIGLAENGGDPSSDGSFFEVDDLAAAFEEIRGQPPKEADLDVQGFYDVPYQVFFVVAPDGLCFMLGERLEDAPPERVL